MQFRRTSVPWVGVVIGVVSIIAFSIWLVLQFSQGDLDRSDKLASIISMSVTIVTLPLSLLAIVVSVRQGRPTRAVLNLADRLDEMAEALAISVCAQWEAEEGVRRVNDPFPLPVRWTNAPEQLTDHWQNIHGDPAPLVLDGQGGEIVSTFQQIPSGRLVVLGQAGAGKTILTSRFVLTLLATRSLPVPVIFSLGSWDPTTRTLRDWLADQLISTYPVLAERDSSGASVAAQLLTTGRILPVLDGFDEISAGLRVDAINAINAEFRPGSGLLLTSRVDEYAAAVRSGDVLTAAAVVILEDLGVAELADYLPRTHKAHTGPSKWMPVVDHLRAAPGSPLTRVLSTPLMVALARTIFSDTDTDPAELLEVTSESELEQRLLTGFVPAVYSGIQERDVNEVHRWLRFLATHLNRQMTYDLAWWRLVFAVPRAVVGLAFGLTMMGLVLLNFVPIIMAAWPGNAQQVWLAAGLEASLVVALASGVFMARRPGLRPYPSRVRLKIRGRQSLVVHDLAHGMHSWATVSWVATWLGMGLLLGIGATLISGSVMGILVGAGGGISVGLCLGFLGISVRALGAPVDPAEMVTPRELLDTDRGAGIREGLIFGFAASVVLCLAFSLLLEPATGLAFSEVFGPGLLFAFGLAVLVTVAVIWTLSVTVWGPWLIARFWLPLTGQLPWSIMEFLADAHRRGVLRQAGGVYQFRHARLQDHLAR